jgi:hypothetical protein
MRIPGSPPRGAAGGARPSTAFETEAPSGEHVAAQLEKRVSGLGHQGDRTLAMPRGNRQPGWAHEAPHQHAPRDLFLAIDVVDLERSEDSRDGACECAVTDSDEHPVALSVVGEVERHDDRRSFP